MTLITMSTGVIGFERLTEEYDSCFDFEKIYVTLRDGPAREMYDFFLQDGYLFRFRKLCIPRTSLRDFLSWEVHAGGLAGHFHQNKIIKVVKHRFYWPSLKRDVAKIGSQYRTCQLDKQQKQIAGPYTPLPVPNCSWQDVSLNFILELPKTQKKHNSILVVVDRFSKMAHFIPCFKISDASRVAVSFFDNVIKLHGILKTMMSDRDVKFVSYF